jgi:hypothetical protein
LSAAGATAQALCVPQYRTGVAGAAAQQSGSLKRTRRVGVPAACFAVLQEEALLHRLLLLSQLDMDSS